MKSCDEVPGSEISGEQNAQPRENQSETVRDERPLLADPWKTHRRSRVIVKDLLLKVQLYLGAVCGMEWYCYVALGILTAILSFVMDLSVSKLQKAHQWLYMKLEGDTALQFFCWTLYPAFLCVVSSSFSDNICPFSTGSGLPEVRVMLTGMEMPHYLSLTNMFTKFLGLICTLAAGSTVFLGKVGPFVHLSTMVGSYLSNLHTLLEAGKEEKAAGGMLAVAAAVGVASCFGAPVSGVLFSVEVMSSHFALKNYYPCFVSVACGALTFRLFSVWSGDEETLQAMFKTNFPPALPFLPLEILLFALLGLLCGVVSCCYLFCHRWILHFAKTNTFIAKMLTAEKGLYSGLIVFLLASVTFPHSAGQYMASKHNMKQLLTSLLGSGQSISQSHNATVRLEPQLLLEWTSSGQPVHFSLAVFLLLKLWMSVLACTLPLPAGYFMPVFIYGAALGRLFAEAIVFVSSTAGTSGLKLAAINPGGYALAGAAAFSGAVTHTLSPALLALELTGQVSHTAPVLLATLLSNALARSGNRPSFYDALSISKKLPHLPSLMKAYPWLPSTAIGPLLKVNTLSLEKAARPVDLHHVDNASIGLQIPVIDTRESPILLGFVLRSELLMFLHHCETETLEEACSIHPPSVLLSPHNTVQEAFTLLCVSEAQTLFIADKGRLVGLITWPEMKRILEDLAKECSSQNSSQRK